MELLATELGRLAFLLEADAALTLDPDAHGVCQITIKQRFGCYFSS